MAELFDVKKGIEYCGDSRELFESVLEVFVGEFRELIPEIKRLYQEENWGNYIVRVHGLKNSALTVGAVLLSEASKKMEFAGKEGRYEEIRQNFEKYCELMERTLWEIEKSDIRR